MLLCAYSKKGLNDMLMVMVVCEVVSDMFHLLQLHSFVLNLPQLT